MKKFLSYALAVGMLAASSQAVESKAAQSEKTVVEASQTLTLKIVNGHLGKVILGLSPNASDKYDRGLDDMAPPPGMQTGYTALVSADKKHYLYRDTRKPANSIEWIFFSEVYKEKPVTISWNKSLLFKGYKLSLEHGDKTFDMSKVSSITLKDTTALMITATKIIKK